MTNKNIIVLGAGVSGLTTALLLSRSNKDSQRTYSITILATHMPGDTDPTYASPWAGANYMPVSPRSTPLSTYDRHTWPFLSNLAHSHPESGIHFQPCTIYNRAKDASSATAQWFSELLSPNPWFKDVVPDFEVLREEELPSGVQSATRFTSVCINTAIYLPWLVSECLRNGVVFKRAVLAHIDDAKLHINSNEKVDLIINATGLGSLTLGGVQDKSLAPARGQIVLVRNVASGMVSVSGTDDGPDEACYIMMRAAGGGTILGGSYQKGNWDGEPDLSMALRIMKRAIEVDPSLVEKGKGVEGLNVIRHGVGLRPVREGGTRVEKERIGGTWVVHNYGHGGAGYQSSWGCAMEAVKLVEEALGDDMAKAKL